MVEAAPTMALTLEDFLAWEREQTERYERVAGIVRLMVGETAAHNIVAGNVYSALRSALTQRGCRVFMVDFKTITPKGDALYPDVLVVCPPPPDRATSTEAPNLVVEVLSSSTEHDDQTRKRWAYLSVPSLRHYVLIDQLRPRVELVTRQASNGWHSVILESTTDILELTAFEIQLSLAAVYEGISFEQG